MSFTDELTVTWKVGSRTPVVPSSLTSLATAAPFSWLKLPPTKTDRPSGDGANACTDRSTAGSELTSRLGTKAGSTAPVPGSKAKRPWRLRTGFPAPTSCTWEKVPPTIIRFPSGTMAVTMPSRTLGVLSAGLAETTPAWGA